MPIESSVPESRTVVETFTQVLRDEDVASILVEWLGTQNMTVDPRSIKVLPRGYTGALLVVVGLRKRGTSPKPDRYVLKLCPPGPFGRDQGNAAHLSALDDKTTFSARHVVGVPFAPLFCPRNRVITIQDFAPGHPLGSMSIDEQIQACQVIRAALLGQWTGSDYDTTFATLAELVRQELRGSLQPGGWLYTWARERALLDHPNMDVAGEADPLPNPFHLFGNGSVDAGQSMEYLIGRTHGDLHADNILVPYRDDVPNPAAFRLIDLATYDEQAPLSRDIAALMMSLMVHHAGNIGSGIQDALLGYLLKDHRDDGLARLIPPVVAELVDVLRVIEEDFLLRWEEVWHLQLKVSLLAQAMLHAAYSSSADGAPEWSLRLAGRLTRRLLGPDAPNRERPAVSVQLTRNRVEHEASIVDRDVLRAELRTALLDDDTSVVAIHGPAGVGKTALVADVLNGLGWLGEGSGRRVCWHEPALPTDVTIQTLIADIEGGVAAGTRHLFGPRSRARLEIALDAQHDNMPVIVVDAAEKLLDDNQRIRDGELDMAIESIAGRRQSRVKIIMVTLARLRSHTDVTWPDTARHLDMSGLEPHFLVGYLRVLDSRSQCSRLPKEDDMLLRMHKQLAGNPRTAELFHALIVRTPLALENVAQWLDSLPPSEVRRRVVLRLAGNLPVDEVLVLEALAAFGVPVDLAALEAVLRAELPGSRCAEAAQALVTSRIVRQRGDGRLQIPAADIDVILSRIDHGDRYAEPDDRPTSLDLLHRAANEIYHLQKDYTDIHTIGDLDMHLLEIDLKLRARMFDPAYEIIERIDDEVLQRWGLSALLRRQRETVHDHLRDDGDAMQNHAALGAIYSSIGETVAADHAFAEALTIARRTNDAAAIRGVMINMAVRYWEADEIAAARDCFSQVLELAQADDDDADRALAFEGLADCDQQQGDYGKAFDNAEKALAIARDNDSERIVDLALKLARWRSEYGDLHLAAELLAIVDGETDGIDRSRRGEYHHGQADLLLHRQLPRAAVKEAQRAVDEAEDQCDPEILLQSLTTLALSKLYLGDVDDAAQAIIRAMRYWSAGNQLDTLALRALIAFRLGKQATAEDFFTRLNDEARQRTERCDKDSWAWDFRGLAGCFALALGKATEIEPTRAAFRRAAAGQAIEARSRNCRVAFLAKQIAAAAAHPVDLLPIIDDLALSRPCPADRPSESPR